MQRLRLREAKKTVSLGKYKQSTGVAWLGFSEVGPGAGPGLLWVVMGSILPGCQRLTDDSIMQML